MKKSRGNTTKYLYTTAEGHRAWTQTIIREWMSALTHTEFKCVMFIFDRTAGWKKQWERIPHKHFVNGIIDGDGNCWASGTGLAHRTVINCLASLVKKKIVLRKDSRNGVYSYSLNYRWENLYIDIPKRLKETVQNLYEAQQEEDDF